MVPLGGHLATLGVPRGPLKGPSRKSHDKVDFLSPFGRPKGPFGDRFSVIFVFFSMCLRAIFRSAFWKASGVSGDPSNHENDGFVYTISHFHLYPQSDRKLPPMGTLWAPFGLQNAENGGPKDIGKTGLQNCLKKVTQLHATGTPVSPLKDSQNGRTGRPTGP